MIQNPAGTIRKIWSRLRPWPGGAWLFSRILGRVIRYSGSIGANVITLEPGFAQLELKDKARIRNHLNSIHALALANLGEYTSGLAMLTGLPDNVRGIPIHISVEYLKKARGRLVAESTCEIPDVVADMDYKICAEIRDRDRDIVSRVSVTWRLGLKEKV